MDIKQFHRTKNERKKLNENNIKQDICDNCNSFKVVINYEHNKTCYSWRSSSYAIS